MGSRGRKSGGEKTAAARMVAEMGLPKPPEYLDEEEAEEWCQNVAIYPADRFPRSTHPMLEAYCINAVLSRRWRIKMREYEQKPDVKLSELNIIANQLNNAQKAVATYGVRLGIARTSMGGRHNNDPDDTRDKEPTPWAKKPR